MQTNGQSPEELAVAHGVANFQRIMTERDESNAKLTTAEKLIAVYKIEIEGYRAQLAAETTRTLSYQQERDDAVAKLAKYETMYTSFYAQMRAFGVENTPFVKPTDDAFMRPTDDEPYGG